MSTTTGTTTVAGTAGESVADAMITRPHLHPVGTTVAQARAALTDSHVHLLLLVEDGRLRGTVERGDLDEVSDGDRPALDVARLEGRTLPPDQPLPTAYAELVAAAQRRRAVVDAGGRLLGLLCLKRSGRGFCTDDGVAARAEERGGDAG